MNLLLGDQLRQCSNYLEFRPPDAIGATILTLMPNSLFLVLVKPIILLPLLCTTLTTQKRSAKKLKAVDLVAARNERGESKKRGSSLKGGLNC